MTCDEVMARLEKAGSEQTRKTYARHGVKRPMFGVSYGELEKLRKRIKTDHLLALDLWAAGNHDARVLATMIADPAQCTPAVLCRWIDELDHQLLSGGIAKLASKTGQPRECFLIWSRSGKDLVATTAWTLVAEMAKGSSELTDEACERLLVDIEMGITGAQNFTRYAMNNALIAIGIRNPHLEKLAIEAAERIGPVEVDHGDTACKTPDAVAYITKAKARKKLAKGKR